MTTKSKAGATILAQFGWSERADQIWQLLLRGPMSTDEVVNALQLERSETTNVHQILSDLAETTIVIASRTTEDRWDTLEPREAHQILLRRAQHRWSEQYEKLRNLEPSPAVNLDQFLGSRRRRHDEVETLIGGAAVRARLSQLRRSANESVRSMAAPQTDGGPPEFNSDTVKLLGRGISVDVIIDTITATHPWFTASLLQPGMEALRVHVLPVIPMRLMIVDEVAVVPIDPAHPALGAYVLANGLAAPALALMEAAWQASSAIGAQRADLIALTPRERQVCQVLVLGGTDDQIARQIGLSGRTVRKVIAAVEEKFGVSSRTVLAYRLGILESGDSH